jgi:hypothetical protein
MADISDVANALVSLIAGVTYPAGTAEPSIVGLPVMIYQGWPNATTLDKDLNGTAKKVHVSVYPGVTGRVTESFAFGLIPVNVVAATVEAAVDGDVVTIGGSATAGQNLALLIDGAPFGYTVQAADTPTSIATALATIISRSFAASSTGPALTIPGAKRISASAGGTATMLCPLERNDRFFMISIWAPSPDARDRLAALLDAALRRRTRIALPDGTQGVVRYRNDQQHDDLQKTGIWRRDINYAVEYLITDTVTATQVVSTKLEVSVVVAKPDGTDTQIASKTIYS